MCWLLACIVVGAPFQSCMLLPLTAPAAPAEQHSLAGALSTLQVARLCQYIGDFQTNNQVGADTRGSQGACLHGAVV